MQYNTLPRYAGKVRRRRKNMKKKKKKKKKKLKQYTLPRYVGRVSTGTWSAMEIQMPGGHLFPFLHKNWNLKYKTWLGGSYILLHGSIPWKYKFQSQNLLH